MDPEDRSDGLPGQAIETKDLVRVLLIDDDEDEAILTRSLLASVDSIRFELDWVQTFGEGLASIARGEHAAFLIDHELGGRTGVELVGEARRAGSLAALIMLTGRRDRATDLAAMEAGATDFLLKGGTDAALLDRTLRYAISQAAMVSGLEQSRDLMAGLVRATRWPGLGIDRR
jgi:DNA-binding response OmpR family regulator